MFSMLRIVFRSSIEFNRAILMLNDLQRTSSISTRAWLSMSSVVLKEEKNFCCALIVGLGNLDRPQTRHSVGMQIVDGLAACLDADWSKSKETQSYIARKRLTSDGHSEIILLKSVLPMNINGKSVKKAVDHFRILPGCVFLIHDELDKSVGKFGIKVNGSARGHNGVRSVVNSLSSDDLVRLRIGIGRPVMKTDVTNYVLGQFTKDEAELISSNAHRALTILLQEVESKLALNSSELVKQLINREAITDQTRRRN